MSNVRHLLSEIRAMLEENPESRPEDPREAAAIQRIVVQAISAIERAGRRGLDWDNLVRIVGRRVGRALSDLEQRRLGQELEKLGISFKETSPGKFQVISGELEISNQAKTLLQTAREAVDDFESAMTDILDVLKRDPAQRKFDADRRVRLDNLIKTLRDVLGGSQRALSKVGGA
jgi:hypothetical protein